MPALIVAVVASAAGLAAGSAAAAAILGAAAAGSVGFALIAGAVGAVVSMAVGYGLSAVFGLNRQQRRPATRADDRKQMVRGSIEPRKVVYGRARVSGPMAYFFSSGEDLEFFHLVVPLAGHPIEAVDAVWLGDTRIPVAEIDFNGNVTNGRFAKDFGGGTWAVRIRWHLGDQTTADAELVAASPDGWDASHIGRGVAYLYVRLRYDGTLFAAGPPAVSAEIRGKRVFDPRSGQTAYSANAALCVLDYLTMADGVGCTGDELNQASFIGAANICAEWVALAAGGQQRRYEINGAFALDSDPLDIMDGLLTACAGALPYIQGQYRLHVGAYDTPTDTLTEDDLAGPAEIEPGTAAKEMFNAVRGLFIDPARGFQSSEFPAVRDVQAEADDGGVIWREAELPYEIDPDRAQRLAKLLLRRTREGATISAPVRYAALRWCTWQTLSVSLPDLGYAAKPFRIVSWALDDSRREEAVVVLRLREERAASYAWAAGDAGALTPPADSTLVDPLTIPAPSALALTPTTSLQPDGTLVAGLLATWSQQGHPFVTGHEVQWRVPGGPWSSAEVGAGVNRHTIAPVLVGQQIEVRVRAIAALARSAWSTVAEGAGAADLTPPGVPTGLAASGTVRAISISWTLPTAPDLAAVEVWENTSSAAGGRYFVGETRASGFLRAGLQPAAQRWYWVRARDRSGNVSAFAGPASATTSLLVASDIQDGILNAAKFASSIEPVGLVTGVPTTKSTEVVFNKTDGKLYRWDGTAYTASVPAVDIQGTLDAANFPPGIGGPEIVTSLPTTGNFEGRVVYLTTDDKLYRWTGTAWTASVAASDITGALADAQIAAVAASKVTGQLTDAQVAALAAAKLTGQITTTQISDNAISAAKIDAAAVTTAKLAAGAVTADTIAANAVTAAKIQAGAVEAAKIAAGAIDASKIVAGAVTADKIATNAITSDKINANAITANKILAGAVGAAAIAANVISADKLVAGAVTAEKIATNAITSDKIAANSIVAGKIAAGAISTTELAAGAVRATNLASETLITQAAQLGTAVVTNAKIGNLEVDTIKIAGGSVSNTVAGAWSGNYATTTPGTAISIWVGDGFGGIYALYIRSIYTPGEWSFTNSDGAFSSGFVQGRIRLWRNGSLISEYVASSDLTRVVFDSGGGPNNYQVQIFSDGPPYPGTLARFFYVELYAQYLKR